MSINEVELIPDFSQAGKYKHLSVKSKTNTIKELIQSGAVEKLGRVGNHTVYMDFNVPAGKFSGTRFYALNNRTDLVDMTVDGKLKPLRSGYYSFDVNTVEGRTGSSLRAHEFYRAILLIMPIIFVSNLHTYGGMRVWQELSRFPDIEVFGWSDDQPVNIDPLDSEETHVDPKERSGSRADRDDPELKRILNMRLVAHKRIQKNG